MIVKNGRIYLWENNISEKQLVVKVGSGRGSSEYVQIDQDALTNPVTDNVTVMMATEAVYNDWVNDNSSNTGWVDTLTEINNYLDKDNRKIVIYVKINTSTSFELGEMGLFVKGIANDPDIMISRVLMEKQYISHTESKIIKYTINI